MHHIYIYICIYIYIYTSLSLSIYIYIHTLYTYIHIYIVLILLLLLLILIMIIIIVLTMTVSMSGFCSHFNNLRFRQSQNIKDFSAAHVVVSFVSSETPKCSLSKRSLDRPTLLKRIGQSMVFSYF